LLAPFLSISPVREEQYKAKRKPENELQSKMESHLLLVTEYSHSGDKEIPFVGYSHSALPNITC